MDRPGAQLATDATPVDHAMDQWSVGFEHLLKAVEDGDLDHYDGVEYVVFMQAFERMRNRMALVDHRLIRDAINRGLPETLAQTSMQRVLTSALRISEAEASQRVRAAEQVGDRRSMLGEPLPPVGQSLRRRSATVGSAPSRSTSSSPA